MGSGSGQSHTVFRGFSAPRAGPVRGLSKVGANAQGRLEGPATIWETGLGLLSSSPFGVSEGQATRACLRRLLKRGWLSQTPRGTHSPPPQHSCLPHSAAAPSALRVKVSLSPTSPALGPPPTFHHLQSFSLWVEDLARPDCGELGVREARDRGGGSGDGALGGTKPGVGMGGG